MTDKEQALAEIGFNPKFENDQRSPANTAPKQRAPASAGEVEQRKALKGRHSERVFHGGGIASGSRAR